MKRGFPGTPVEGPTQKDTEPDEEKAMNKAAKHGLYNSHANLMNEGEDDDWRQAWERQQIQEENEETDNE